ncbi:tol-pal system-associated acyl-CoA thioesterase [Azoarcus indigens]|uniref:Acyl-CoA thioester hydrolase n=1 Tax=Azoarcus indigens TaxID=29545 RepID=A0A4R6E110_9RHOO|nr:tol-pal system-associated acyl-CoA thioesterase [Azoarcus indigens]NMG65517.1 tol-pal system-associated acyl-CoA thioesterase [Azoarcus indigens]TDN51396.1 acyl-CoA thioester hydrolase [Azoarcus indigens]
MHTSPAPALPASAREFVLPVRVYYEDTDAAGVVYYANYLRFCERARTEWLRALGFEQQQLRTETNLVFVVRSVQAEYLSPGLLDDALEIVSTLGNVGRASITFVQKVMRAQELLFEARVLIACVDWNKKKAAAIPAAIRNRLEQLSPA